MGDLLETLTDDHIGWALAQKLFFVSTGEGGHLNCSSKGGDCFTFLDHHTFIFADYTGSGNETIAHLHQNGRILIMLCSFEGPPRIMRLHGRGTVILPGHEDFETYSRKLPKNPGLRSIIHVSIQRASVSCGFAVPCFDFVGHRDLLDKWATNLGPEGVAVYREEKNQTSIDGLPGYGQLT
jgi:hypothetical protein